MFCNKCGNKLAVNSKFCSSCGAKTESGSAPNPTSSEAITSVYDSWWETVSFANSACLGFVNVEAGSVWLSDTPIYSCKSCGADLMNHKRQDCGLCGRLSANSLSVPVGAGDGTYPVVEISRKEESQKPLYAIISSNSEYTKPIHEDLKAILEERTDIYQIGSRLSRELGLTLGGITKLISFGNLFLRPHDTVLPNFTSMVLSGPRSREFLDCAEVRIIENPGSYEVFGVVDEALDLKSTSRPEVLAVLLVHSEDVESFYPRQNIFPVDSTKILSKPSSWIENNRMSRGDLPAIWANWTIVNAISRDTEPSLNKEALGHIAEGYLHQIWTWYEKQPEALKNQLESMQKQAGFTDLIEFSREPALDRELLEKWFSF